jgi:hypothetical protein
MMHANTEVQCVPQVFIGNELTDVMHFLRVHLKEGPFEFKEIVAFPLLLVCCT